MTPPRKQVQLRLCEVCGATLRLGRKRFCSTRCAGENHRGARNGRYNGGLCFDTGKQRWVIYCRDGSLVLFSRAVMEAELKRPLSPDEIVHHRNGDTTDDQPENLQITTRAEHMAMHRAELVAAQYGERAAA